VGILVVTVVIILTNAFVLALELMGGETLVTTWPAIPAQIVSGHHWITIITAMFLHGSWSHIIGRILISSEALEIGIVSGMAAVQAGSSRGQPLSTFWQTPYQWQELTEARNPPTAISCGAMGIQNNNSS
jgi:hypothetical protein